MRCLQIPPNALDALEGALTLAPADVLFISPDPNLAKPLRYGPQQQISSYSASGQCFLSLEEASEETIRQSITPYLHSNMTGVQSSFCNHGKDVARLDTILSVLEAEAGLQERSLKIIVKLGRSSAAFLQAETFKNASPRLVGLSWCETAFAQCLQARSVRDEAGKLLPPFAQAQSTCLFAARNAQVLCYDSLPQPSSAKIDIAQLAHFSRLYGFNGMVAHSPAQLNLIPLP
ncbi:hypothetical protein E1162_19210 [Rhodobacteraceae bacterium RKSG542]|uniref:hypothetical protein n=1 Tax=Pseudovibrio flavus TaxID=2529854 RepID=UPI0012BCCD96|nr:hypothetical protein [Pseudovibrio flavus]MTI19376.1 hypothetical protein [Pseudovibrio flavus]